MTMTRPPSAGPGRQPPDPGYFSHPGRGFRARRDTRHGSPRAPICSACWPPDSPPSACPRSTRAGPWPATWPRPPGWSRVLLASMVAHELAHSIMARRYGLSCRSPWACSGGAARPRPAARLARGAGTARPRRPWRVAAAAASASLLLGLASAAAAVAASLLGAGPAGRRRVCGSGLAQRPAGCGQPGSGGGTGWRADRPSARVGALGRSHPRGSHRRPLRPGQRRDPGRGRGDRAGAGSPDRPLVRADRPAHGRGVPG